MRKTKFIYALLILFSIISSKVNAQQEEINSAIQTIFQNQNVNKFIQDSIIDGKRGTIRLSDLVLLNVGDEYIQVLNNNDISFLYLPYIELNNNNRDAIKIINLDGVSQEEDLRDMVSNNQVSQSQIVEMFTIMYKTEAHQYDINAIVNVTRFNAEENKAVAISLLLDDGWLPWRRCYCSRSSRLPNDDNSSIGKCNRYHQEEDRCLKVCDRTGFLDQTCDGEGCPGC